MTVPRVFLDLEKNKKLLNIYLQETPFITCDKRLHLTPVIIVYSLLDISFIIVEFTQKIVLYDMME